MPSAPPRLCSCGAILAHGQRCQRCARSADKARGTAAERGYDASWVRLRRRHLKSHPACAVCGSTEGVDVDHRIPFAERPDLRLDWRNLQTLCRLHHNQKTHSRRYPTDISPGAATRWQSQ
jgi:5-methylcytosine-specific restriction protein A